MIHENKKTMPELTGGIKLYALHAVDVGSIPSPAESSLAIILDIAFSNLDLNILTIIYLINEGLIGKICNTSLFNPL